MTLVIMVAVLLGLAVASALAGIDSTDARHAEEMRGSWRSQT